MIKFFTLVSVFFFGFILGTNGIGINDIFKVSQYSVRVGNTVLQKTLNASYAREHERRAKPKDKAIIKDLDKLKKVSEKAISDLKTNINKEVITTKSKWFHLKPQSENMQED